MDNEFKILFYVKENGRIPFLDFYYKQDVKMKARIDHYLLLLELKGNKMTYPYSEKLDKHIFELRIIQGNNISRVLYFFYDNKQIIVTNGFVKKQEKTPKEELAKANNYRQDWLRRKKYEK